MTYEERHRIYMREYYWRHRQECLERCMRYRETHRQDINRKARHRYRERVLESA